MDARIIQPFQHVEDLIASDPFMQTLNTEKLYNERRAVVERRPFYEKCCYIYYINL